MLTIKNYKTRVYHQYILALILPFISILLLFIKLIFLNIIFFKNDPQIFGTLSILYKISFLTISFEVIRRFFNSKYILAKRGIIVITGILSFNQKKSVIYYEDIREVSIKQSIIQRILNYGSLFIATSSQNKHEAKMRNLYNPEKIAIKINKIISQND